MDSCVFSLTLSCTNQKLPIEIKLDQETVWQGLVGEPVTITHQFPDTEGNHTLSITLDGKTPDHTKINSSNKIIEDSCIEVTGFMLDGIDIGYAFYEKCIYTHDLNGTGNATQDSFFGTMGCNGTVTFSFSSPVYLWLLENI